MTFAEKSDPNLNEMINFIISRCCQFPEFYFIFVSRLSSVNGGRGGAGKSDPRPISDMWAHSTKPLIEFLSWSRTHLCCRAYRNSCIRDVIEYLTMNGYDRSISPKVLSSPTSKDFIHIVTFLFRCDCGISQFVIVVPMLILGKIFFFRGAESSFLTLSSMASRKTTFQCCASKLGLHSTPQATQTYFWDSDTRSESASPSLLRSAPLTLGLHCSRFSNGSSSF